MYVLVYRLYIIAGGVYEQLQMGDRFHHKYGKKRNIIMQILPHNKTGVNGSNRILLTTLLMNSHSTHTLSKDLHTNGILRLCTNFLSLTRHRGNNTHISG